MKQGDTLSMMLDGHLRRADVRAVDEKWVLIRLIGWDGHMLALARADEGTRWLEGCDEETQGALRAAYALKDEATP
jgi:hypothetical protein